MSSFELSSSMSQLESRSWRTSETPPHWSNVPIDSILNINSIKLLNLKSTSQFSSQSTKIKSRMIVYFSPIYGPNERLSGFVNRENQTLVERLRPLNPLITTHYANRSPVLPQRLIILFILLKKITNIINLPASWFRKLRHYSSKIPNIIRFPPL